MATQYTAGLTTGQVLTAATMNSIGAAWEAYTPTLTQSAAVTKTVTYAKYCQINKLIVCNVRLDVTGTGTASAAIVIGLPITAAQSSSLRIGASTFFDSSTSITYNAAPQLVSNTTVSLLADGVPNFIGVLPNVALGAGDQLTLSIHYEAA